MTARTARWWAVLVALVTVVTATVAGTGLALVAGGMICVGLALAVMALDSQRKRGRTRR
jgi:hypothetical protein